MLLTKLFILKTGEYVIAQINDESLIELYGPYKLHHPKVVIATNTQQNSDDQNKLQTSVVLLTWPQFTLDTEVEINFSAITSIVNPIKELCELYENSLK
jgi:hypothetical protein